MNTLRAARGQTEECKPGHVAGGFSRSVSWYSRGRCSRRRFRARKTARQTNKGVDSGNYNIQQSVEFGYRANEVNGNKDTYDTFINLGSGVRLFDYTLDMRSLNHQGLLFDNLSFSNFGYGGDPNDVSRLHIDKNKWYDFHLLFRRDKNFWDYNLFANPLNPAALNPVGSATTGCIVSPPTSAHPGLPGYCSNPSIASANSPHSLDLVRRMQDYDLTLLPRIARAVPPGLFARPRSRARAFSPRTAGQCPTSPKTTAIRRTPTAPEWISASCRGRRFPTTSF